MKIKKRENGSPMKKRKRKSFSWSPIPNMVRGSKKRAHSAAASIPPGSSPSLMAASLVETSTPPAVASIHPETSLSPAAASTPPGTSTPLTAASIPSATLTLFQ
ncbi:hypothetical protein M9H77_29620 [Catharanthus roseus]|uniref:Uncharacterized protein n=1 Tax=Catharanthus roseus TaxID=4058 RepID=A0ACB9ZZ63_CATRO|nr:hypothetical protein M9H77_29620 [Catharanthus roseus]